MAAVFSLEQILSFDVADNMQRNAMAPGLKSLIALGACSYPLVIDHGDWWRLFTSVFLHASLIRFIGNGMCFLLAGCILETLAGPAWFFVIFFLSGLSGSLASIWFSDSHLISVGASGAIMGMMVRW